jgi:hypothetical protein
MIKVAFRSPYNPKLFIKLSVPSTVSLQELREAGALSEKALAAVRGEAVLGDYPLGAAGALGLMILSKCCPVEEDELVTGVLGGFSFVKQLQSKLNDKEIDDALMADSVKKFRIKYGPHFKKFATDRLYAVHAPWKERMLKHLEQNA